MSYVTIGDRSYYDKVPLWLISFTQGMTGILLGESRDYTLLSPTISVTCTSHYEGMLATGECMTAYVTAKIELSSGLLFEFQHITSMDTD